MVLPLVHEKGAKSVAKKVDIQATLVSVVLFALWVDTIVFIPAAIGAWNLKDPVLDHEG